MGLLHHCFKLGADERRSLAYGRVRAACVAAAAMCAAALMLPVAPLQADENSQAATAGSAGQQVDLDIVNANLLSVVSMLRMKSGAQIVVAGGDQSYHPVTLTVTGPLPTVLRYVAVSAGATVSQDSDGVYVFRPASSAADAGGSSDLSPGPSAQSDNSQPSDSDSGASQPHFVGPLHTERIVLQYVDPNFILKMINDPSGYRDTNPYHDPDVADTLDPSSAARENQANIVQGNASINMVGQNYQPSSEQPSVPMNNQTVGSDSSTQANRDTTDSASQAQQYVTPGGGGFIPPGGFGGQRGGEGGPGGFGAAGGPGGPGGPNAEAGSLRPDGIQSLVANEQDNSLLVRGDAQGIAELKQIISLLDIPSKQVQIKVEFITANVTDVNQFGISWDFLPIPGAEAETYQGNALQSTYDTFLSYAQGNMVARLYTYLSEGRGKNISSPIITTTNNTPASIFENIEIPYVTTTTVAGATGGAVQGQSVNFLNIPTGLSVLPRINGDNSVTLVLNPRLEVPGTSVIPNGPPPVTTEELTTIRTVADGETMVLGGLVTKDDTNNTTKIPILGDLPIIGGLFRTKNENINNSELLIFVTPTVLPTPGEAASLSGAPPSAEIGGSDVGVTP